MTAERLQNLLESELWDLHRTPPDQQFKVLAKAIATVIAVKNWK